MSQKKSLKLNFIMNSILTMSNFIFPLITFPYVSRILLSEGTGKVSFAVSLISYFLMFAQLGIPTYGIRVCAKVRDNRNELTKTAHELFIINFIMTIMSYLLLFVCLFTIERFKEDRLLYIIVSFTIILNTIGMDWLYKALEQYTYITIRSMLFKFLALIAMFVLVHEQNDYVIYGGISIFASCASNLLNFINIHKYIDIKLVGNYNLRKHLKSIGTFFAMSCATIIYTHIDTIMLGFISTDSDVGYYTAAVKIKTILVSIVTSLGAVLLPRVSYYVQSGMKDEFEKVTKKALNFVFVLAMPLTIYFILFAKHGIYFLSGVEFGGAVLPMQIIMPTLILIGITNVLGIQILVPTGREKYVLYSEIVGAIVNLILNAILIPTFKSTGAAIGTLVAEFMVLIVQYIFLKSEINYAFKSIKYYKIIIAVVLSVFASLWVNLFDLNSFITLLVSAICFFGIYLISLVIMKEKLVSEIIVQVLKKFSRKNMLSKNK